MNTNETTITLNEIERLSNHCLKVLCLADSMSDVAVDKNLIIRNLRKLYITSLFRNKTIICISGLQGVGKTTMMRIFYDLDSKFLPGTLGRGERLPVFFSEKDIKAPEMHAVRIVRDDNHVYSKQDSIVTSQDYDSLSKGEDESVLYLEIIVPYKYTSSENVSFMLLPGYESSADEWRELISFSVHSSDAAVFVFSESKFANVNTEECLNDIKKTFGENLIYAITNTDTSTDNNQSVKQTCIEALKIPAGQTDRIVCTGAYTDLSKNKVWIEEFQNAVEKYAMCSTALNRNKNTKFLYEAIIELRKELSSIRDAINRSENVNQLNQMSGNNLLAAFDKALAEKRTELEKEIKAQFDKARKESNEMVEKEFAKNNVGSALSSVKRFFFGESVKDKFTKTRQTIERALGINDDISSPALPDKYLRIAMQNTLSKWEQPDKKTDTARLLDTKKENGKTMLLPEGKKSKALVEDVRGLLIEYNNETQVPQLQSSNDRQLMGSIVEMSTYHLALIVHDQISERIGMNYYALSDSKLTVDKVVDGAKSSKKLAVGLAGVIGIDLIGDGTINMVSQLAASLGIAAPLAGAIAGVLVGAGAVCAIAKDINSMRCADCFSAQTAINSIYDRLENTALSIFDDSMAKVRKRIDDNIYHLSGMGQHQITVFNARAELNNALTLLNTLAKRIHTGENPMDLHS